MSKGQQEREVKLAVPPSFRLPPLTDPGGGVFEGTPETLELDARYYDTSDLRLARAGALLRHRSDEGWTVKLPGHSGDADALTRDEHHFEGDASKPPDAALDLVRALLRTATVKPVARLHTVRRRVPIHGADGTPVAEVVDDRVEVVEGATFEQTFREVEVELAATASADQRTALLARLRAASAGNVDPTPKIVRALGPRATAAADVEVPTVGRGSRLETVVQAAIAACVVKLIAHDPGVRLGGDAEDVHQARVATRRLRSHLRTFRPLVDERWANDLRDELRWLADVLGAVRDADVLLERLEHKVALVPLVDQPSAEKLLDQLRSDLERRRSQLITALRGNRYLSLLDRLVLAARRPRLLLRIDGKPDADVLRGLVRRPWEHLEGAVAALPDDAPGAALHNIRIRAKRARYAAEAVEPAFGKPARAYARAITELQDVLGEHQDAVIAAEWLRATATRTNDVPVAFAAGELAGLERHDVLVSRDAWSAAWKQASRRRLREWM
ncbi:MAG: CYTH and CHAD domain-containing protein [Acidimicrobiia bacterium]